MANTDPLELIASPFEVYLAPAYETEPATDATPAGNWELLGTNGKDNQAEGGVTVQHMQTLQEHRTEGMTGPIKVTRTAEGLKIALVLTDMSPEQYTKALAGDDPTSVNASGSTAGYDHIPLYRGIEVDELAVLVRGPSPLISTGAGQWYIPRAFQSGQPQIKLSKSGLAGIAFEFTALVDPNAATESARFGRFSAQDTA